MSTDLTFFTNEPDSTLLDRFKATLKHAQYFDILVGYFRSSGFHLLYESFEEIEKIRILVGLNVGRQTYEIIDLAGQSEFDFNSHKKVKDKFSENLSQEIEISEDTYDIELGVRKFIEFLKSGKIEIKAYPSHNIHAKVYITRFPEDHMDYGRVITGSSNFTYSGLVDNYEFNVELKNSADVKYALDKFERLWKDAIDISETYVDTINNKTWLNDEISPYHLYLKLLYEYFKEDINMDEDFDIHLPEGFMELKYQKQAVVSAKKILEAYRGVFLSDVVGLGKTFISALLAQQLPGKKLIICPPVLKDYWRETFLDFNVSAHVESLGKLDHIIKHGYEKYDYIFIDECHRFRNEYTQSYEKLFQICFGKKIILVSATPLNNKIEDIYSQLKLFQVPKNSTIPGVPNLDKYFSSRRTRLDQHEKGTPEYSAALKEISNEIREQVLKYVTVRRTRTEIINYYSEDIQEQGLSFPDISDPERIVYEFDSQIDSIFNKTISMLKTFRYSRYTPLLYLKKTIDPLLMQSQKNIGGFMKGILVKRLESSFFAFKKSLSRFIISYEKFIEMFGEGTVYISKKVDVYDLLESDDEESLLHFVEEDKVQKYESTQFKDEFIANLKYDLQLLKEIQGLWINIDEDPKLEVFIKKLKNDAVLKNNKIIIFTESSETGRYLYEGLNEHFSGKVMFFCSGGGVFDGKELSHSIARDMIKESYDPNYHSQNDDITILISTDVLSEGINLHRSNVVINYDLPWNPTRVLQRIGRVNRVGTIHQTIHIFNFFPTSQSDDEIGLEKNIKAKIQAFHDILGEDAKYLTEEEEVSSHELFGDRLYKKLTSKEALQGEEEDVRSELEYLKEIRHIRDDEPQLFEKIKRLPKKGRSCKTISNGLGLITFFRKGLLKKFFITEEKKSSEMTFLDAVDLLRCEEKEKRHKIPKDYYELIELNKEQFAIATSPVDMESSGRRGRSNEDYVIKRLKANDIKHFKGFTDDDEDYIKEVLIRLESGVIPKNTTKKLKKEFEKKDNQSQLKVLGILKKNIPDNLIYGESSGMTVRENKREVILSEYLLNKE